MIELKPCPFCGGKADWFVLGKRNQYEKGYQDGKAEIIDYKALKMALDNINDIVCGCNEIHCCVNDILVLEIQKELSEILDITGCPRTEQEDTD